MHIALEPSWQDSDRDWLVVEQLIAAGHDADTRHAAELVDAVIVAAGEVVGIETAAAAAVAVEIVASPCSVAYSQHSFAAVVGAASFADSSTAVDTVVAVDAWQLVELGLELADFEKGAEIVVVVVVARTEEFVREHWCDIDHVVGVELEHFQEQHHFEAVDVAVVVPDAHTFEDFLVVDFASVLEHIDPSQIGSGKDTGDLVRRSTDSALDFVVGKVVAVDLVVGVADLVED